MKIKTIDHKDFLELVKTFGLKEHDVAIVQDKDLNPIHYLRESVQEIKKTPKKK